MQKKEIIQKLSILKNTKSLNEEQKAVVTDAIKIIRGAKKWEQCIKAVEMLLKLLGIGSKYLDP